MKKFYKQKIDPNLDIELQNYIIEGGFPKALEYNSLADKRTYVRNVINEIYEKDIKKRIQIRNKEAFDKIQTYIINNFGSTTSISNIYDELTKSGIAVKRTTLVRYVQALIDAKILYQCKRFDVKSRRSLKGEQKYYLADLSFYFVNNVDNRINYGPVLENIVYQYARSTDYEVSVGKIGRLECDFIIRDQMLNYAYIQVAMTIMDSRETEDREYRVLEKIRDNYPKYVLTRNDLIQQRSGIIHRNIGDVITSHSIFT
jgi:hypothetical protein